MLTPGLSPRAASLRPPSAGCGWPACTVPVPVLASWAQERAAPRPVSSGVTRDSAFCTPAAPRGLARHPAGAGPSPGREGHVRCPLCRVKWDGDVSMCRARGTSTGQPSSPCQTRQWAKETQSKGDMPRVQKVPAAQKSTMCPFVDRSLRTYYVLKLGQTLRRIWGQKQGRPHTEHAAVGG